MQREKGAGGPGLVWMLPRNAKMEARKGRWSDINCKGWGNMKKGSGSLLRYEYCCVEVERETEQTRQ